MDVKEMKPARKGGKVAAKPVAKGATGHALALQLVQVAEEQAEKAVAEAMSRKGTLARIERFTREDHVAFRKELDDRMQSANDMAGSLGVSLNALRRVDTRINTVCAVVSLWRKMSAAVETGYRHDPKETWDCISLQASERLAAKGVNGSPVMTESGAGELVRTTGPTARRGRKAAPVSDKVIKLLTGASHDQLLIVAAWLQTKLGK